MLSTGTAESGSFGILTLGTGDAGAGSSGAVSMSAGTSSQDGNDGGSVSGGGAMTPRSKVSNSVLGAREKAPKGMIKDALLDSADDE